MGAEMVKIINCGSSPHVRIKGVEIRLHGRVRDGHCTRSRLYHPTLDKGQMERISSDLRKKIKIMMCEPNGANATPEPDGRTLPGAAVK